jgi:hypothetical protein
MTINEFRRDKGLVDSWGEMLKNHELLRLVLGVLEESHPARHSITSDNNGDLSPTRAAIELGTTRGYSLYADRLKMLAVQSKPQQPLPEPSYEPAEAQTT